MSALEGGLRQFLGDVGARVVIACQTSVLITRVIDAKVFGLYGVRNVIAPKGRTSRGVWGHAPPENFLKFMLQRSDFLYSGQAFVVFKPSISHDHGPEDLGT